MTSIYPDPNYKPNVQKLNQECQSGRHDGLMVSLLDTFAGFSPGWDCCARLIVLVFRVTVLTDSASPLGFVNGTSKCLMLGENPAIDYMLVVFHPEGSN